MKAILSLEYNVRFPLFETPSCQRTIGAFFEREISIPALPVVGLTIDFPVICDISETCASPDDCKITRVAFDLKNGVCVPHIFCEREINGEEVFEAGDNIDSELYRKAMNHAREDIVKDIVPRMECQGFKKKYIYG
jgi:hypothetical protein